MHARRAMIALSLMLLIVACSATTPPAASTAPPAALSHLTAPVTAQEVGLSPTLAPPATAEPATAPTTVSRPTAAPSPTPPPSPTVGVIAAATATTLGRATAHPAPSASPSPIYVFPVRSQGKITYGRFHHDYPATDIFCAVGSDFLAVTDGVVDFVSREDRWDPKVNDGATRGGLAVAIIGDDGVRYYGSHLSQVADGIEPGVRVTAGQLLGQTGHSGDARTTDPHLHFGISHPTTPDDWQVRRGQIGPYDYLFAWQRGENITPKLP
jgi:murein DD-endopeptidase MepM/ murein hydrolase activator NlpD